MKGSRPDAARAGHVLGVVLAASALLVPLCRTYGITVPDEKGFSMRVTGFRVDLQCCSVDVLYGSAAFAHQLACRLYVVFHLFPSCLPVFVCRNRIPYIAVVCSSKMC
jgi:hypothetical protein